MKRQNSGVGRWPGCRRWYLSYKVRGEWSEAPRSRAAGGCEQRDGDVRIRPGTVLAFVLEADGPHLVRDREPPTPQILDGPRREVRVRMRRAGICNTDLELARGYMGFRGVLGHEFVGEALEGSLAGKRVVAGINFGCATCRWCEAGIERHCPQRRVLGIVGTDGAMAERLVVPESNLRVVPDGITDDEAVFAEPLAAACQIVDQLAEIGRPGDPTMAARVLGAGKLGPLIAQVLAAEGRPVELVGRHLEPLEWLRDRGVTPREDLPATRCPLVIDATGTADGLRQAIAVTEPRGTLVLKTTVAVRHEVDLAPVVIDEITVLGSRCGRIETALESLAAGQVATAGLIDALYDLEDVERGFTRAAERGVRKILLRGT